MQFSYSRVDTFKRCPYKYKLRYIDGLEPLPTDDPANALVLGHALHTGIEKSIDEAVKEYYAAYPIINDQHVNEAIKLEYLIPKVKALLPAGKHEVEIKDDDFLGYIDLLVPVSKGQVTWHPDPYMQIEPNSGEAMGYETYDGAVYDIYDFKYSNNVKSYLGSQQLHLYKYFYEKLNYPDKIRNLYFVFIPKSRLKMKKKNRTNPRDETLDEFRRRTIADLEDRQIQIIRIDYDPGKVIEFLTTGKHLLECEEYKKVPDKLCDWCDYKKLCQEGEMMNMALPKNERVAVGSTNYMKGWIYGAPFSGKTTFLDKAPDPLNLNTDGNVQYVTMQRLPIRDEVTTVGRVTNKKFAWEVFKEAIDELEKGSDFKTIIVDLVEDTREMCRLYMYNKLGIQHETDAGYGKGWDMIKTEYLSTMRRLMALDYNIFLVSHEDISKDITRKSGEKITKIAPNIQEAVATKLAGMVHFVARVIVEDDDTRVLSFKHNEVIFGGGRLGIDCADIPLKWEALEKVYADAVGLGVSEEAKTIAEEAPFEVTPAEVEQTPDPDQEVPAEAPKRRRRRKAAE